MVPRVGGVLARQLVQVDSSVCRTDRGRYHCLFLGSHPGRYVVFSAVGAVDLCCSSCPCVAHKPVRAHHYSLSSPPIFVPTVALTYAAIDRVDSWMSFLPSVRIISLASGLTKRWSQPRALPMSSFMSIFHTLFAAMCAFAREGQLCLVRLV